MASFKAARTYQPIHTGGHVLVSADASWLFSTLNQQALVTELATGTRVKLLKGVRRSAEKKRELIQRRTPRLSRPAPSRRPPHRDTPEATSSRARSPSPSRSTRSPPSNFTNPSPRPTRRPSSPAAPTQPARSLRPARATVSSRSGTRARVTAPMSSRDTAA